MKPKTMILMGLAVTCGLGASYMTSRLLAERQTADEPEKVEILVAAKNLSVHQKIYNPEELFERKLISKENEPSDAIRDFDQLKGKSLKVGRMKGDHVTAANLYDKGQLDIPEGHQAVGIRVNVETTASGLASLPGSKVDLLLTMGASQDPRGQKTIVLLQEVLVLAADIRVTPDGEIAAPAQVVTFGLKQREVLEVTTAKKMGEITLVLRKNDDRNKANDLSVTGAQLLDRRVKDVEAKTIETVKVDIPKPEPKPEVKKPEPKPEPVKVITGSYDVVIGAESGQRTVTRVHWSQTEDGEVTIVRSEVIDVSGGGGGSAPIAPPPAGGSPKRGGLGNGRDF